MPSKYRLIRVSAAFLAVIAAAGFSLPGHAWEADKLAPWVGTMFNGTKCDGTQVPFGPYDYLLRDSLKSQLEVVEENHFNEGVESLTQGMTSTPMGDIHYTLLTWPNHHRALKSALQYRLQHRELWKRGDNTSNNYPAECYLQRAMNFSPNDPIPYVLHGLLMHQMKRYDLAIKSYRQALKLHPDDIITQYNLGLTLVEKKQFREAQAIADKVYAAGFPLPGLKRKLAAAKQGKPGTPPAQAKAKAPATANQKNPAPANTAPKAPATKPDSTAAAAAEPDKSVENTRP